jgi:hypothetical protein
LHFETYFTTKHDYFQQNMHHHKPKMDPTETIPTCVITTHFKRYENSKYTFSAWMSFNLFPLLQMHTQTTAIITLDKINPARCACENTSLLQNKLQMTGTLINKNKYNYVKLSRIAIQGGCIILPLTKAHSVYT